MRRAIYAVVGGLALRLERHLAIARLASLQQRGAKIGHGVTVFGGFHFHGDPRNLEIGDNSTINAGVVLNASARLVIGAHVRLSNHVQIQTDELLPESGEIHREHRTGAVVIGDGAWLASGSIIVPGVTVGARAIVGHGNI